MGASGDTVPSHPEYLAVWIQLEPMSALLQRAIGLEHELHLDRVLVPRQLA